MYFLPEIAAANSALYDELRNRLARQGFDAATIQFDGGRASVPDGIEPNVLFTQICGYPLFKRFRSQGRMLATPCYNFAGCEGPTHRAYFIVRSDDPANSLEDLRGRIFGCNSLVSNSGMNLPRLSLAHIADGKPFFSAVVMTGGHMLSLDHLRERKIDVCSIDNVTWGFFQKHRKADSAQFRILDETVASPSLPFVTSSETSEKQAQLLTEALFEAFEDPSTLHIRNALEISSLEVPDIAAYEQLALYEEQARQLGYPEII
ncbi:hypothetical protein K32_26360 [Kaistia sp. 32K]|uniref:phosphate/phosphite/phosphonate ABC transporter substrate-binding protein n=1 Tax=Kaistia sp. 32K TaxID=2795690 RepID=UPI001914DCD9|nr:PhnD/SsuA/transferrin family substrate-binding protein [Kaistia sp. 32K]BCP54019.1 hypothetical protein K32_26360 [Kaistia sp. 32K]